jgi:uncharacterized delta-60 repeat protein
MKFKLSLLSIVIVVLSSNIFGAPGDLDPTFNGTGKLLTSIKVTSLPLNNMLEVQPDGKILVGIQASNGTSPDNTKIYRYNANGTPDTSFGIGGFAAIGGGPPVAGWDRGYSMALQPDGKILVAGVFIAPNGCGTVRLNANGTIDTSFNTHGWVRTVFGPGCYGTAIKAQSDGKIVLGGYSVDTDANQTPVVAFFTMRYNSDGSTDPGYGSNGLAATEYAAHKYSSPQTLLIQPDGKIVLAGTFLTPTESDFGLVRFTASGSLDSSFGTGGFATAVEPAAQEQLADAALQADGKIVVVGSRVSDFTLARFNTDGTQDMTFGSGGFAVTTEAAFGTTAPGAIAVQPDGKILVGGNVKSGGTTKFAVARYNADGSLDNAFARFSLEPKQGRGLSSLWGANGIAIADFGQTETNLYSIALDAAGRILVSGNSRPPVSTRSLALARFLSDGSPYAYLFGTVRTAGGMPIKNISVVLNLGDLSQPVYAMTNQLGNYVFTNLPVTENYSVSVNSKRFTFAAPERYVILNHDTAGVDFTADP